MLMLDTGIRASEVSSLKIVDVDQRNQRIQVMGKGSKERSIPFSLSRYVCNPIFTQ